MVERLQATGVQVSLPTHVESLASLVDFGKYEMWAALQNPSDESQVCSRIDPVYERVYFRMSVIT